ncbi:MAG TPA: tetratricopeptide repeat protein [Candidatus Saccharimonadales bacterium]|nr:tetratricopeptide repeat protein [Candidatus Saccharimonadales bacterium]
MAKFSLNKKKILGIAIVVGILAAAAAAGFWLQQMQSKSGDPNATDTRITIPDSVASASDLASQGKTDEANKKINEAVNNPATSNDEKYQLYITQANIAFDKQDYKAVETALLKAWAIRETKEIAARLGTNYEQLGDKPKAIEYLKKAIQLNPDSNPLKERQNEMYAEMIRNLGGQP